MANQIARNAEGYIIDPTEVQGEIDEHIDALAQEGKNANEGLYLGSLSKRGFQEAGEVKTTSAWGRQVTHQKYVKTAKFGKVENAVGHGVAQAALKGVSSITNCIPGQWAKKTTAQLQKSAQLHAEKRQRIMADEERPLIGERTISTAKTVAGTVGTLGLGLLSEEHRDDVQLAWNGKVEKDVLITIKDGGTVAGLEEEINKGLKYDPKDVVSVQEYLEKEYHNGNPRVRELSNGDVYMIENKRKGSGISSFIFAPNGDFSKAKSVQFFDTKNGKGIFDEKKQLEAVRLYSETISGIEGEWEKMAEKLADGYIANHSDEDEDEINRQDLIDAIIARRGVVVIDPKFHCARVLGSEFDLNNNPGGYWKGVMVKFDDATSASVDKIYNMDHKTKLGGKKPYNTPPHERIEEGRNHRSQGRRSADMFESEDEDNNSMNINELDDE